MSTRPLALGLSAWLLGLASAARATDQEPVPSTIPPIPAVVVSGDGVKDGSGDAIFEPVFIEGAEEVAIENPGDEVPRPEPALVESGPEGDVVLRPATGNPFFLGFAAGPHYPAEGEKIDPKLGEALAMFGGDMRPAPVVYGFCMFEKRITAERIARLEELGVRNLGFHPHHSLRVALPPEMIPTVSNLDFVRWVGVARDWQKVHPALDHEYSKWDSSTKVAVYISVFEDDICDASTSVAAEGASLYDPAGGVRPAPVQARGPRIWTSNGWQQKALQEHGVAPTEYLRGVNVFRAEITWMTMQGLLGLDFVQFVELEPLAELNHDESVPLIAADSVRATYDGGTTEQALVGEIDSGVDIGHSMLDHPAVVGWDHSANATGVFTDVCGHGTHVAGTIFGKPTGLPGLTGVAPDLGWANNGRIRIVKYLDFVSSTGKCSGSGTSHATLYGRMRGDYNDGSVTSGPPHVINNSWGADPSGGAWVGTETNARIVDDEVHKEDQVYVFAAGNAGSGAGTIGLPACAKNVITVGSVVDFVDGSSLPGELANTSSRGSLSDNRWKPNVTAPGRWIASALAGTSASYTNKSGTSMAAPHVTGVIAQLNDGQPAFRYDPARTAAVLMATATPKDNELLTSQSEFHLDQYGAGRVNAHYARWSTSDSTFSAWTFTKSPSTWSFGDFTVPAGTTRVVVVMHYVEPAAGAGASKALVNDFDLWIDRTPIDTANGNTGEYSAQQSVTDNTEIRMIDNPIAGSWRWKVYPDSATQSVKMAVVVRFISDDTTPNGTLTLSASDTYIRPFDNVDVTASFYNPDVVASAVYLDSSVTSTPNYLATSSTLLDGIVTDLSTNQTGGVDLLLGDITDGKTRSAKWTLDWASEGVKSFGVSAKSDNADSETATVNITVDGTDPSQASSIGSSTHTPNIWKSDTTITYTWSAATDNLSGLAGYSHSTTSNATALPDTGMDIGAVTSLNATLASSAQGYYFNLRSVDNSGNWDNTSGSAGPYLIDAIDPSQATNLKSTTHAPNSWSNDPTISYAWTAASDTMAGLAGYSITTTSGASGLPDQFQDLGPVTTHGQVLSSNANGYYFNLRSVDNASNWDNTAASIGPYLIDTIAPSAASSVMSTDHATGVWSQDTSISMAWTAAADAHSGLLGYDTLVDTSPSTVPSGSIDASASTTSKNFLVGSSASPYYFHIRSKDVAGNWGATVHQGPYSIDNGSPTLPGNVQSPTHPAAVWSNESHVAMTWSSSTDTASGVDGYAAAFTNSALGDPTTFNLAGSATSTNATLASFSPWYFHLRAKDDAGNEGPVATYGPIKIDLNAPSGPSALSSSTHSVGVLSDVLGLTVKFAAATEVGGESGIAGYATVVDEGSSTVPTGALNLGAAATGANDTFPPASGTKQYWFHVRAQDQAGNWGTAQHLGPFVIGVCGAQASNTTYGAGKPGTSGVPLLVALDLPVLGTTSTVMIKNARPGALPLLILGFAPTNVPWDGGTLLASLNLIIDIPVGIFPDGTLPLIGALPVDPTLCGVSLYHQVLIPDPGATGFYGMAMTPGLKRTFGS